MAFDPKKPPSPTSLSRPSHQHALWCRACAGGGRLVSGLCSRCYARRRWDQAYFAGLRERVLARDSRSCQVCHRLETDKRTLAVHHRRPGISREALLIALCPACHARVHRLGVVRCPLPLLLLALWREQHPDGVEQLMLDFTPRMQREQLDLSA
jgi:5-methylcytosine-specific restriction endonuclease McrA